jgi:hypothetical protein
VASIRMRAREESWNMTNMIRNMYIVAGVIVFFVLMNNKCGQMLIYPGCQTEYMNTLNDILKNIL